MNKYIMFAKNYYWRENNEFIFFYENHNVVGIGFGGEFSIHTNIIYKNR